MQRSVRSAAMSMRCRIPENHLICTERWSAFTRDYEAFRREPLVEEFLESELRVCRMIQNITLQVTRAVDLDTEEVTAGIEL